MVSIQELYSYIATPNHGIEMKDEQDHIVGGKNESMSIHL